MATVADDLYGIEDEIEAMAEWEPGDEFPTFLPDEAGEFVAKRFLAIRFTREEVSETEEMFARQIELLLTEIQKLEGRRDEQTSSLRRTVRKITTQLVQFHRASVARTEREHALRAAAAVEAGREIPKLRLPTTVKGVHGQLRSKAGGNALVRIEPGCESDVVRWLYENEMEHAVRVKPAVEEEHLPDLRKLQGLVHRAEDGKPIGIKSEDGELCPHITIEERERDYWITLPDGSSSKDWADE